MPPWRGTSFKQAKHCGGLPIGMNQAHDDGLAGRRLLELNRTCPRLH